jgi:phosphatidylinositol glycan class T
MPYNVITLTGTIFALFFGSVLNVLVRRMKNLERINNDFVSTRPIARLARRLLQFIDGK